MSEKKPVQLKVIVTDEVAEGQYVNFANIFHSPTEFVIDFGRVVPGKSEVKIMTRIISTPFHARRFLEVLQHNISTYEQKFGPVRTDYAESDPSGGDEIPS